MAPCTSHTYHTLSHGKAFGAAGDKALEKVATTEDAEVLMPAASEIPLPDFPAKHPQDGLADHIKDLPMPTLLKNLQIMSKVGSKGMRVDSTAAPPTGNDPVKVELSKCMSFPEPLRTKTLDPTKVAKKRPVLPRQDAAGEIPLPNPWDCPLKKRVPAFLLQEPRIFDLDRSTADRAFIEALEERRRRIRSELSEHVNKDKLELKPIKHLANWIDFKINELGACEDGVDYSLAEAIENAALNA